MTKPFLKRCWALIYLDNLLHNLRLIERTLPHTQIMAVVKADAYGHGADQIANTLQEAGVSFFAVSNLEEAVSLRKAGIRGRILILGPTPQECASTLIRYDIEQTVHSLSYAEKLDASANGQIKVHLKLDTGMGRIGFESDTTDFTMLGKQLQALPHLEITAAFSHFSHADCDTADAKAFTAQQLIRFNAATEALKAVFPNLKTHLQNSAGIVDYSVLSFDYARPGIILYGLHPSDAMHNYPDLRPVMELKTCITHLKTVKAGTPIGYSRRFVADREMTVATVPIGYADGYPRLLSSKGVMLVRGQRAPIIGNVCMDQLMLDVTDIDGVQVDDEVTVFGKDGELFYGTADAAREIGTISYELVCLISKRVPRVYVKDGEITAVCDLILSDGEEQSE